MRHELKSPAVGRFFNWSAVAWRLSISGSWRMSTPVRPPSPSAFSSRPVSSKRSAASIKARRRPIPWSWNGHAASRSSPQSSRSNCTLTVNLIDTPGHADFVAEVERSLRVLDGVVLVVSAVEGVQPQTRRLARAIRAAGLPLLIFINKIDRLGARGDALLEEIRRKLKLRVVAMNAATGLGDRAATVVARDRESPAWRDPVIDLLAETNERVIEEFDRTGGDLSTALPRNGAADADRGGRRSSRSSSGRRSPASASPELLAGIEEWLPTADEARMPRLAGTVFKIARRLIR